MEPFVVVNSTSLITLAERVNALLRDGYKPLGGIAVSGNNYLMAMIK